MRILEGTELRLFGSVGYHDTDGQGFTSVEVLDALAAVGTDADITVRINSGGGYATEGVAVYNALARHRGRVVVAVDGVAASAASLIAMAGDDIVMATGSLMMIHDPSLITFGTSVEHGRSVHQLEVTAAAMAAVYASRSGRPITAIRAVMAAETWLTGDQAVEGGFATRTGTTTAKAAASFDYSVYAHVPFTALAAMRAQARADSPAGRAGAVGWVKAAARLNGPAAVDVDPATSRAEAIRAAAAERGMTALGEDLVAGKLPVADALARLHRYPAAVVMTSALDGVPTLANMLARQAR